MNIALIGYGKMGKAIEAIALKRGHRITGTLSSGSSAADWEAALRDAEVAVEFTGPEAAFGNVNRCFDQRLPVVSGSTGWNSRIEEVKIRCEHMGAAFLHASNFSIGVNIFFAINKRLAVLMDGRQEYSVDIEEVHHLQKKDAPSGTAITLAEQIVNRLNRKERWMMAEAGGGPEAVPVKALREDGVPGTHRVSYDSPTDRIDIIHTAHNREGFAMGAVLAAEFIGEKRKGVYTMADVLGI